MPDRDETEDYCICQIADKESRVVITKDSDFYDSHLVLKQPAKLLIITTGNLKNRQLLNLFRENIPEIIRLFDQHNLIELTNEDIIVHS